MKESGCIPRLKPAPGGEGVAGQVGAPRGGGLGEGAACSLANSVPYPTPKRDSPRARWGQTSLCLPHILGRRQSLEAEQQEQIRVLTGVEELL